MSESAYLTRAREFVRKHWTAAGAVGFPTDDLASLLTQVRNETAAEKEQDNKRLREALEEIDKRPFYTRPVLKTQIDGLLDRYNDCLTIARNALRGPQ